MRLSQYNFKLLLFVGCTQFFTLGLLGVENHAIVTNYHTTFTLKSNTLEKSVDVRIQINSAAGKRFSKVALNYQKGNAPRLSIHIEDVNGNLIRKIKKSELRDASAYSQTDFYNDRFIKSVNVNYHNYPYVLHYSYTIKYRNFISIANWSPVIYHSVPTRNAGLKVILPSNTPYRIQQNKIELTEKTEDDKFITLKWSGSYNGTYHNQIYAPPAKECMPYVSVTGNYFRYGAHANLNSWADFGNWEYSLRKNTTKLPQSELTKIRQITANCTSDKEKVKTLYYYLQDNHRYISIPLDIGGLKPYPVQYVVENRYGDCKALSNYMQAALKALGIKSFYTLINAGEPAHVIDTNFPSQQFNHVMVHVPLKTDTLWLECTSKFFPFNYLGPFSQNRYAFASNKHNSFFVQTPELNKHQVWQQHKNEFIVNSNYAVYAKINQTLKGPAYENFKWLKEYYSYNDQEKEIVKKFPYTGFRLDTFYLHQPSRDSATMLFNYNALYYYLIEAYGNMLLLKTFPLDIPKFETPQIRSLPVRINYPVFITDTSTYQLPKNLSCKLKDISKQISYQKNHYSFELVNHDGSVLLIRNLYLAAQNINLGNYPEFYQFIQEARKLDSQKITLRISTQ